MNQAELIQKIEELSQRVTSLEEQLAQAQSTQRDRGPKSQGEMTDEHAYRVKFGDLKDTKHKQAAEQLGLSYGQVFSCRGGYTFKHVKADWKKPEAAKPQ